MNVCKELDEYIFDKDETIWIVKLSNGEKIYQDDGRYGTNDKAWLRLKKYCYLNELNIENVSINFRSHTEFLFENDGDGVFFRRGILAQIGYVQGMYIFGLVKNNLIYVQHWWVPPVIKQEDETEIRNIEGHQDTIIWNQYH